MGIELDNNQMNITGQSFGAAEGDFDKLAPALVTLNGAPIFGGVLVKVQACNSCAFPMLQRPKDPLSALFEVDGRMSLEAQVNRSGWRYMSKMVNDNGPICEVCASQDLGRFLCYSCHETRKSTQVFKMFGVEPGADYLCQVCYTSTVIAQAWDNFISVLTTKHAPNSYALFR